MAQPNDGRIPGGPITEVIRQERESHISKMVFDGQLYDYPPEARIREHGSWRMQRGYRRWELIPAQKELLRSFGFQYLDEVQNLVHDLHLIFSLAERWWPQRNTFQLPVGEMTITLWDVANILGLPITGDPIYFDTQLNPSEIIRRFLGIMPPSDLGGKSFVTLSWLRGNFMDLDHTIDGPIEVDELRILCCTRAYLLCLCWAILFPDGQGNRVNVRLLPFLNNLEEPTRHAWGAATLAYLYVSLTDFARSNAAKNLCGCMTLVQVWCYEHFFIGRPVTSITSDVGIFPLANRWATTVADPHHNLHKDVSLYREQFDTLQWNEVIWIPYSDDPNAPEIKRTSYDLSLHKSYIIYDRYTMYHPADRVLRQFGLKQIIPDNPPCLSYDAANARNRIATARAAWYMRFQASSVAELPRVESNHEYAGDLAYRQWWGAPRMINRAYAFEEPRFKSRAVDESSLRAFVDGISEAAIMGQQYIQEPESYLWPHGRELLQDILGRVDSLSLGRDADMPPLHTRIPADYPAGTVPRRYSRRRRMDAAEEEARQDEAEEHNAYAGEGATQQYHGEGSSQWYAGESTSHQYHGEGSSQRYAGEYSGQQYAGEYTSQQYAGEYTSQQYAGEGTSQQYAGEGTSQQYADVGTFSAFQPYDQQINTAAASLFEDMSYYTQVITSPSAPVITQEEDPEERRVEEDPDERRVEENTDERRGRLGLRPGVRRCYKRLARGLRRI